MGEFEKYRVKQDRLYQSDFDRILLEDATSISPGCGSDDDEEKS